MAEGDNSDVTTKIAPEFTLSRHRLEAISVIDGRYDPDVEVLSPFASEFALISTRTEIEAKYLVALSKSGIIRSFTEEESEMLNNLGSNLSLEQAERVKELEKTSEHDVKAVEKFIREVLSETSLSDITPYIHFLLTSEDVNNLAYRLMLMRATREVMIPEADKVVDKLLEFSVEEKDTTMHGRTHGQDGAPTKMGKETAVFAVRMNKEIRKLEKTKLTGKFNGAMGNYNAHIYARPDIDWLKFSKEFVESLGLEFNPFSTQINPYEDMIEMFQTYHRLNGIYLDMDNDVWRYVSDYWFAQQVDPKKTHSSTMPQKVNPIKIENSEGNVSIANGLFEAFARKLPVSRLQRDLSDSTVIRNVGTALAHTLLVYKNALSGLNRVYVNHAEIQRSLDKNWSVLTEGVQTVLRDHGNDNAYDLVKDASRGVDISKSNWNKWVNSLDISAKEKKEFRQLTPDKYTGLASDIVNLAVQTILESRSN